MTQHSMLQKNDAGYAFNQPLCYASLSVVRLGRCNVDATVDDLAIVFGH
jgi:hypothetical protein